MQSPPKTFLSLLPETSAQPQTAQETPAAETVLPTTESLTIHKPRSESDISVASSDVTASTRYLRLGHGKGEDVVDSDE